VDLAEKVGLTASGVTRLLVPMEKIGLVKRQANKQDARVSFVVLTPVGKRKLTESLEDAEYLAQEVLPSSKVKKLAGISDVLNRLKGVGF
jgi:DNA-binding MarR family transcriptional regulator